MQNGVVNAGTRPARKSSVPYSKHRGLGHARLQSFWSALQEGMLHGESKSAHERNLLLSDLESQILPACMGQSKLIQAAS